MKEDSYTALGYLAKEMASSTSDEIKRLVAAVASTAREFPDYFIPSPMTKIETCKKDIFVLNATIRYYEGHLPREHTNRLKSNLRDLRSKLGRIGIGL